MNIANLTTRSGETAGLAARSQKSGAGGAAGIEIVGFPQTLYTRTFGDPDMLFLPLLAAAREAFGVCERLASHGESHATAVKLSGMQLASSLLSGGERTQARLQMVYPLPRFRHLRGGIRQQTSEQLHVPKGLRISCAGTAAISASAWDRRAPSRSAATRFCSVMSSTIQMVSPGPSDCSLTLARRTPMERLLGVSGASHSCSEKKLAAGTLSNIFCNAAGRGFS
jgi:hypothetical protein